MLDKFLFKIPLDVLNIKVRLKSIKICPIYNFLGVLRNENCNFLNLTKFYDKDQTIRTWYQKQFSWGSM